MTDGVKKSVILTVWQPIRLVTLFPKPGEGRIHAHQTAVILVTVDFMPLASDTCTHTTTSTPTHTHTHTHFTITDYVYLTARTVVWMQRTQPDAHQWLWDFLKVSMATALKLHKRRGEGEFVCRMKREEMKSTEV